MNEHIVRARRAVAFVFFTVGLAIDVPPQIVEELEPEPAYDYDREFLNYVGARWQ